jgi:methylase of polypeptide subunit release factors
MQDRTKDPEGLGRLLRELDAVGYDFIAPTPASQARVLARHDRRVGDGLMDLLGWSLACRIESVPEAIVAALENSDLLDRRQDGLVAAHVRVSRIFGNLFVHSRYPTIEQDSVFLGPDSHRFGDYILRNLDGLPNGTRVLDYGAGTGVGGITAASNLPDAKLTLADINPKALFLSGTNARHAQVDTETAFVARPEELNDTFDLIVMHPPFMIDPERRAYRDGGDLYGGRLSLDWALGGLTRLSPGGRLVMHTGVSIVDGRDVVHDAFVDALPEHGLKFAYHLLDPDIFGDELETEAYADVDRIAAVGLRIDRIS